MKLEGRNLSITMQPASGDDVKLLHTELMQLGFAIADDERGGAVFGKSTYQAVQDFQKKVGLAVTGEVDDKTALEINRRVDALQPKPQPQPQPTPKPQPTQQAFVVQGHVRRVDGSPISGLMAAAWDVDLPSLQRDEPLGQGMTDKDGFYRIEYTADKFSRAEKDTADLRVEAHEPNAPDGSALALSETRYNAGPVETIDLVVTDDAYRGLSEFERLLADIAPLLEKVPVANLTDKDVDFLAGETGDNHQYLALLATAHRYANDAGTDAAVFYGLMREGLPTELTALLAQSAQVQREALKRAVAENIIPAALNDKLDTLVDELQRARVRLMLQPPGGQAPSNLSVMLSAVLPSAEQQATFLSAYTQHQGDIEDFWTKTLPQQPGFEDAGAVERLQYTLQLNVLTGGNVPLVQALASDANLRSTRDLVALDTAAWQERIAAAGPNAAAQIPANIRGTTSEEKIANYAGSIVETLRAAFPSVYLTNAIAVQPAIDLEPVKQVLALNKDRPLDLRQPLPDDLTWDGIGDQKQAQEAFAALRAELNTYPQLDIDASTLLDGQGGIQNTIRAGVQTFLGQATDFDFGKTNIDVYLQEKGDAVFVDIPPEQRAPVTEQLKAFQRVYQVVPRDDSVMALMSAGLHSALAIANVPEDVFVEDYAPKVGGAFQARLIHENARDMHDRAALALGSAVQLTSEVFPRAIAAPGAAKDGKDGEQDTRGLAPATADVRSLYASLFGKLSLCACEDCRSVYSPAAYLVDLLHFVDRRDLGLDNPYRALQARRPDIEHIRLTCENTNTALPYIDLVNEILESYIAYHTSYDSRITSDTRRFTSAELLANPQHVNTVAYNALRGAVYPMTLPYDRDLETVHAYLAHLGTSRHAVMKTCQPGAGPGAEAARDIDLEYLKISPQERAILTGVAIRPEESWPPSGDNPGAHYLGALYGFGDVAAVDSDWPASLASVETFLQRTRLEYDELVAILKTRFINPAASLTDPGTIEVYVLGDTCDLAQRRLRHHDGAPLKLEAWDRLQRFTRLWRKLGWPIQDVDRALTALAPFGPSQESAENDKFLARLSQAAQVRDELNLGLAETLSFWANIDTRGDDRAIGPAGSLYARLFLNPAVRTLAGDGDKFALDAGGQELAHPPASLADIVPALLAALRVTAADFPPLLLLTGLTDSSAVNLEALSALYRHAVLARALRLSVKDLATLVDLLGPNPFRSPADTLRFIRRARKLQQSRFSLAQLAYLYEHILEPASSVAPSSQEISARLLAVRMALKGLADAIGETEPVETRLRKALGQVMDQARTDGVIKFLDGSVVPAQPRAFVERELSQFVPPAEAVAQLIDNAALTTADRQAFLLDRVLAFLSRSLVTQTLAEGVGLDPVLADRLLTTQTILASRTTPARPLIEDFLALRAGALNAHYAVPSVGLDTTQIDPPLDFASRLAWPGGVAALPDDTAFTVQWAGQLIAPATESYTFVIRAAGPVTLKIDGERVIAADAGHELELRGVKRLEAGVVYGLTLEYARTNEPVNLQLAWESRSMPRAILGEDRLFPASAWASAWDALTLLHKVALLVNGFKLTEAEITYLAAPAPNGGGLTFNDLPLAAYGADAAGEAQRRADAARHFDHWEELHDLFTFRDNLPHSERFIDVLTAAALDQARAGLVAASGWGTEAVGEATGPGGFNADLGFFKSGQNLARLADCLALAKRVGVSPAQLFGWATSAPDDGQSQMVKNAVKARYEAAEWLTVAKGLNDRLRERQRDALVDYTLTLSSLPSGIRTSMGLFEYFLVDVDMSACQPTSRIKQAISSVQLFVQRCLMALEPSVSPRLLPADQWQWMRSYRVWEANRKVFLYPENWIEPELRDDKSPFFKELENELLQNDITQDTAESAFVSYLEKLDEVARLDVRGMYWEYESELDPATGERASDWQPSGWDDEYWTSREIDPRERADILHVFARTQGTPPVYYYRRLVNHKLWTPWEKVQADIEGDHLIPVVFNRRLYLFWPLFRELTDTDQTPSGQPIRSSDKKLEIQLAWSEYKNGKWSAKKITSSKLEADYVRPEDYVDFFFATHQEESDLVLICRRQDQNWGVYDTLRGHPPYFGRPGGPAGRQTPRSQEAINRVVKRLGYESWVAGHPLSVEIEPTQYTLVGQFTFTGCDNEVAAVRVNQLITDEPSRPVLPGNTYIQGQMFVDSEYASASSDLVVVNASRQRMLLLWETLRRFSLLYPHQYFPYVFQAPFFYQDHEHAYFVTSEQVADVAQQVSEPHTVTLLLSPGLLTTYLGDGQRALAPSPTNPSPAASGPTPWENAMACVGDQSALYNIPGSPSAPPTHPEMRFHTFFHPYVCEFVRRLKRRGVSGLLALQTQTLSDFTHDGTIPNGDLAHTQFKTRYEPTPFVDQDYPKEDVDFDGGAYALYNWELFFHAPLLIADRLSKNQRFDEARQWFHTILDPTTSSTEPIPQRYWNVLPFYRNYLAPRDQIGELLYLLSYRGSDPDTVRRKEAVEAQIEAWRSDPFNPHHIARMRITAYQKTVLMKYIDNLIAWGDQLFAQDTLESINQATQLYVLAYQLLGPRPKIVPPSGTPMTQSYADLQPDLDRFSNALTITENAIAGRRCMALAPTGPRPTPGGVTLGATLYFCIPPNDKLLGAWGTVEDRLFKIRHCMNIEGVVQQLPLFEPPIDPALLVRARAAGLDLSRVLNDINATLPHYRFNVMLQKALELCGEVRALAGALLSALEKRDAEALSLLRSTHEIRLLEALREVRQKQVDEAAETIAALERSRDVVVARQRYYQQLMTVVADGTVPADIINVSTPLNAQEKLSLIDYKAARDWQVVAGRTEVLASILAIIPTLSAPGGGSGFGGQNLGSAAQAFARSFSLVAAEHTYLATHAATMGSHVRRGQEWEFQAGQATRELDQIDRQIAGARIRHEIASKELANHELQIENARAVDDFMRTKFTNRELYDWMVAQTSALYFQAYQLAYDLAKRAERAYQFERGVATSNFIQFGYWDSLRKGLLAGERLTLDLKRLEAAYMDQNRREYEITKYVSLVLHDPLNLIALKTTGQCEIELPEALFDMDYPGHTMRRIKSVSLTIPAVVGPYTSVNCTLTLLSHKVRKDARRADSRDNYREQDDDDRFLYNFAPVQSIATSHGQNDSGMFELNFRDERYLPFEGAGAISRWRIEIPRETNAFDLDTISDVVLRLSYTARDGGDTLRRSALEAATLPERPHPASLAPGGSGGSRELPAQGQLFRLFSLRHEFPTDWHRFLQSTEATRTLTLDLAPERFPYQFRGRSLQIIDLDLFLVLKKDAHFAGDPLAISVTPPRGAATASVPLASLTDFMARASIVISRPSDRLSNISANAPWRMEATNASVVDPTKVEDLIMVCHYSAT